MPAMKPLSLPDAMTAPLIASSDAMRVMAASRSARKSGPMTFIDWSGTSIVSVAMPSASVVNAMVCMMMLPLPTPFVLSSH